MVMAESYTLLQKNFYYYFQKLFQKQVSDELSVTDISESLLYVCP